MQFLVGSSWDLSRILIRNFNYIFLFNAITGLPGVERRTLVGDLRRVAGDGVRPVPRGLDPTVREGHHVLSSHQALFRTSVEVTVVLGYEVNIVKHYRE